MAVVSNVTNQIISYLCQNIRDGSWPLGSRLPSEHQLCQTLGVSRTSVRSALQQLGALGIVESVRGKGTYLRSLDLSALEAAVPMQSPERLRHLMEFARLVWPSLCGNLACGIEEDSLLALEQTARELHTLEPGAWKRLIHLVMEFHYALATPFHNPILTELAENFLRMLRPDKKYSPLEAKILDLALVLHMEHGGGNNSTFTTHVVSSSGTDTYSTIAAALGSLKGPKHGGANIRVVQMMKDLKAHVHDTRDEEEVAAYLLKLLNKEAFDKKGLIYGMGHAVYTKSDPRCQIFKKYVGRLSEEKGRRKDYELYTMVERLAPKVIAENRRIYKGVSANVDFYSGLIYSMLDIPEELFTPMFAIARIVGWSAHRLEELINVDKIIRPAYISVGEPVAYQTLSERNGNE